MSVEVTKNNLSELLSTAEKMFNSHSADDKEKARQYVAAIIKRIKKVDLKLPDKRIVNFHEGQTMDIENIKFPKEAILYRKNGSYKYMYYYDTTDDKYYFSLSDVIASVPNYYIATATTYYITHYHYCEELDVLIGVCLHINGGKNGEPTVFECKKDDILLFTRDKKLYTVSDTRDYRPIYDGASTYTFSNDNINDTFTHSGLIEEFQKMFVQPIMNIGANNFVTMDTIESLVSLSSYNAKLAIKDGPKQRKIDELTAIELLPPDAFENKGFTNLNSPYAKTRVEKVKDNTCVVRWMLYGYNSPVQCDGLRIYIEGKDIFACKLNNDGKFIRTTISTVKPENFLSSNMCEVKKEDLKGTLLEYYGEIINDVPEKYRSLLLISFVKEPKLEQLFKMGLHKLIFAAFDEEKYNILEYVADRLASSTYNIENKNIYKFLGVTKYQFNKFKTLLDTADIKSDKKYLNLLRYVKEIFGEEINSVDNKTFDSVFNAVVELITSATYSYWSDPVQLNVSRTRSFLSVIKNTENANLYKHAIKIVPNLLVQKEYVTRLYGDYISMVNTMEDFHNFKIGFSNETDIREMHDAALAIYNLKRETYRTRDFNKQLETVKKLVYENEDDDFCVVIPSEAGDLAREGLELHHCVKSYIEKVADGRTNIVFIRKKSDKEKPFFTVEVSNEKVIEQVHGFSNRNANTEPGLTEFVNKWAKNKRLKVGNINKIR